MRGLLSAPGEQDPPALHPTAHAASSPRPVPRPLPQPPRHQACSGATGVQAECSRPLALPAPPGVFSPPPPSHLLPGCPSPSAARTRPPRDRPSAGISLKPLGGPGGARRPPVSHNSGDSRGTAGKRPCPGARCPVRSHAHPLQVPVSEQIVTHGPLSLPPTAPHPPPRSHPARGHGRQAPTTLNLPDSFSCLRCGILMSGQKVLHQLF